MRITVENLYFAPTLTIGSFSSLTIGLNATHYSSDWPKIRAIHWLAYAMFDPICHEAQSSH